MGFSVSQAITQIYMEYCEEIAVCLQWSTPAPWWKRYVDDIINMGKKVQVPISW